MARIGIDLDGVLYPFHLAFRSYLIKHLRFRLEDCQPDPERWGFYQDWGLTDKGFARVCHNAANDGELWDRYPAQREDVAALDLLRKRGHTLHIITDRQFGRSPAVSHKATAKWLLDNDVPYDTLTFAADKSIVATDYMVDDKLENYEVLNRTACTPYLLDQPWNRDELLEVVSPWQAFKRMGSPDPLFNQPRRRVKTVTEFANLIIERETSAA